MIENIIVAITNITALLPIITTWNRGDYVTMSCIVFVAIASFISHLFENHKHGMPGLMSTISPRVSYLLNRFDVFGVTLTALRFFWLIVHHCDVYWFVQHASLLVLLCLCSGLNVYSEYDKYNPDLKTGYIITHSMWHLSIFVLLHYLYLAIGVDYPK